MGFLIVFNMLPNNKMHYIKIDPKNTKIPLKNKNPPINIYIVPDSLNINYIKVLNYQMKFLRKNGLFNFFHYFAHFRYAHFGYDHFFFNFCFLIYV